LDNSDPLPQLLQIVNVDGIHVGLLAGLLLLAVLLICSAAVSGSEVAFFSLSPTDKEEINKNNSKLSESILSLLNTPKYLLATILIANNLINVSIIILSTILSQGVLNFAEYPILAFVFQAILITLLILLFGEILPKIYANKNSLSIAMLMALPLKILLSIFKPLSTLLINSTSFIEKKFRQKGDNITMDELSHALDLTVNDAHNEEEKKILKGIVNFGNTDVKQIMTPRIDVVAFELEESYPDIIEKIHESGYSRIPIYKDNFDVITGVLYIKDLIPYLEEKENFDWTTLLRPAFFVPENKKIDDLLKEFQEKKIHMAVVVDEYGGTSGIVTLEDIIEEIVGDIMDEFDDDDLVYSKLDENNYIFEGKTLLNDLYRILSIDGTELEAAKGDADTLAGFILEQAGKIPKKNEELQFTNLLFKIEAADARKINTVKVSILNQMGGNKDNE
jgi:putative hemolysin